MSASNTSTDQDHTHNNHDTHDTVSVSVSDQTNITWQPQSDTSQNNKQAAIASVKAQLLPNTMLLHDPSDMLPCQILPNFYISNINVAMNAQTLSEHGITHIVNASASKNWFPLKYQYCKIDIFDWPGADIQQHFPLTNQFIQQGLQSGGKVLVHCHAGVSRSATLVLAYLLEHHELSLQNALKLLKTARECICPNHGFLRQLKVFEEILEAKRSTRTFQVSDHSLSPSSTSQ